MELLSLFTFFNVKLIVCRQLFKENRKSCMCSCNTLKKKKIFQKDCLYFKTQMILVMSKTICFSYPWPNRTCSYTVCFLKIWTVDPELFYVVVPHWWFLKIQIFSVENVHAVICSYITFFYPVTKLNGIFGCSDTAYEGYSIKMCIL